MDGSNVAGDSVIGSEIDGSVILPMPKATDANAAQWGGSDLTITDLAALAAKTMDQDSIFANMSFRTMTGRSLTGLKQVRYERIKKKMSQELMKVLQAIS